MASKIFRQTLQSELGSKFTGKGQQLEILEAAEKKGIQLAMTIKMNSKDSDSGFVFDDPQIDDFFEAADALVNDILRNMANEDVEELANQNTRRQNRKSTTNVSWGLFRDKKGKTISAFNLERLLNLTLSIFANKHMGVGGQLKWQTGRLAHSGTVTGIESDAVNRKASFFFTYMLYPYEVFENRPDGRYEGSNYSPIRLFQDAIDSALRDHLAPSSYETINKEIIFRGGR